MVAVDEHLEQVDPVLLVSLGGVVSLGDEDGVEGGVGRVVGAGLADRFELAVELGGAVAVAVAEHALVVFGGELGHGGDPAQELGFSMAQVAMRAGHDPAVAGRHYTGRVLQSDRELADAIGALLTAADDSRPPG